MNVAGAASTLSVSCTSAGNCSAGGLYGDGSAHQQTFVDSEVNGSWGTAVQMSGTAALNVGGSDELDAISCSSRGNCSADGFYIYAGTHPQAFVIDQVNGTWGTAIEVAGTAALNACGNAQVGDISCPTAGNCSAGGFYTDATSHIQAFGVNESSRVWGTASEIPGSAALNAGGAAALTPIACSAPGTCSGAGLYPDVSSVPRAFVIDEVGGTWGSALEAPGSALLNTGGGAALNAISCTPAGNCDAAGIYPDTVTRSQAFFLDEVNGQWGNAEEVPGTAVLNEDASASVLATSCSTFGNCGARGYYRDAGGNLQTFVVEEIFTEVASSLHVSVTPVKKVIKHTSTVVSVQLAATGLATATGSVAFSLGSAHLGAATIANGAARCTATKKFNKGKFTVSAKYLGDQFYAAGSASAKFSVK